MSRNRRNELLPSYQDVVEEEWRVERSLICVRASRMTFLIANILISILTIGGFFIIRYTDTFSARVTNITKYCNDSTFHVNPAPQPSAATANGSIILTFALCYLLLYIKGNIVKNGSKKVIQNIALTTWILGMHLLFLFTLVEFLKCAVGTPRPYFFSNPDLKDFYCENKQHLKHLPFKLEKVDDKFRKSFPSHRAAIYGFCTTFLYFYMDHYDIELGLHAIQQLVIIIMGSYLTFFQLQSWEQGENHLSDILVGASIGAIQAMITIRSMFGSVFYSHVTHAATKKVKKPPANPRPSAPPMHYMEYQGLYSTTQTGNNRALQRCNFSFDNPEFDRSYGSANTLCADNENERAEFSEGRSLVNNVTGFENQDENEIAETGI